METKSMETRKFSKLRTFEYAVINAAYFAAYSGVHAYAAVFLLDRGFSNTMIGVLLALANIVSVLLQPVTAGLIDKYTNITNRKVSIICSVGCLLCCAILYFAKGKVVIFAIYMLLYMLQMLYQPILQALSFEYNAMGAGINFGLARGLGSCGFAFTSALIGKLLEVNGVSVLQIVNVLALLISIMMLFIFVAPKNVQTEEALEGYEDVQAGKVIADEHRDTENEIHNSFIGFTKYYPMFMLFVLGATFLFFEHNALNDYLIQIITPLGGDEAVMGNMVMVAAFLELPTMAGFASLERKFGIKSLLIFSAIMFTVKTVLMLVAQNVFMAYLSQICQIFAYALFIPGGAYLAEKVMTKSDKTKGQAYINCCITLGGVFSALVCGRILDIRGAHAMLIVASVVGVIGTVISIFAISRARISADRSN